MVKEPKPGMKVCIVSVLQVVDVHGVTTWLSLVHCLLQFVGQAIQLKSVGKCQKYDTNNKALILECNYI